MRGWPGAALLLLLLVPLASAAKCTVQGPYGPIEYVCADEEPAEKPKSFADDLDVMLGVLGLVGSAGAGGFAIYRVRSRRQLLTRTLAEIESTYVHAKSDPEAGITRLAEVRADVRAKHEKGKLDDGHFLELDKRATDHIVKLRLLEIDRRFAMLPPLFLAEIRRLLADGVLSQSEADLIEVRASVYRIQDPMRSQLADLARRWAADDSPPAIEVAA